MLSESAHAYGRSGESQAAVFLRGQGYVILQTNWRTRFFQVDIVAEHEGALVIVEVKSRRSRGDYPVIGLRQVAHLRTAAHWLGGRYPNRAIRIDLLTIYWEPKYSEPTFTLQQDSFS